MTSLIAKRAFRYAGRMLRAGERFETRGSQDARVLTAIGRAEYVQADDAVAEPGTKRPRGRPRKTPQPAPQPEPVKTTLVEVATPDLIEDDQALSRFYNRRDMEAE